MLQALYTTFVYTFALKARERSFSQWQIVRENHPDWGRRLVFDLSFLRYSSYFSKESSKIRTTHICSYIT